MDNVQPIAETSHDELMQLLNPLVDYINKNGYSFFLVAGKDGVCSRHMAGDFYDITGMITGMMETNKQVRGIVEYCADKAAEPPVFPNERTTKQKDDPINNIPQ